MSEDMAPTKFPTRYRDDTIERYNTHRQWMIYAEGMAKNAMPKTFTAKMKWIDCKVMSIKFLKYQPGSNRVLLNYVVRDNINLIISNNPDFLDD